MNMQFDTASRLFGRSGLVATFCYVVFSAAAIAMASESLPSEHSDFRGLMFPTPDGELIPAPEVETSVQITVTGMIARTKVIQLFRNPTKNWLEGIYMFPLPENSSVDSLVMHIGDQRVLGHIDERYAAQQAYADAAAAGQRAALLESERPNIFTASVANIGPEDEIAIEFEYQEPVRYQDGVYSLRFPMTVGVRYIPGQLASFGLDEGEWSFGTDQVPDASRILQPVIGPDDPPVNPVRLTVELDAGYPILSLESHHHEIRTENRTASHRFVMLEAEKVPADRDFELTWTLDGGTEEPVVFLEQSDAGRHAMLFFVPPASSDADNTGLAREVILVLDKSGSMQGTSIRQAKEALRYAVGALTDEDTFNIVTFNNAAGPIFQNACPASPNNKAMALRAIDQISADGGTEMATALDLVLAENGETDAVRQVIFITDGQVGNEAALFRQIRSDLGNSRLYTVGIGSAPNSHFMSGAARAGRGTYTFIGSTDQVTERMKTLFRAIQVPLSVDIQIGTTEGQSEIFPNPIPDLHAGEPFMVTAEISADVTFFTVSGRNAEGPWSQRIELRSAAEGVGVAKLWAKDKISDIQFSQVLGATSASIRDAVLEVALSYGLITEYTALVAIAEKLVRPDGETLVTRHVPANLPDGWVYEGVFGPAADDEAVGYEEIIVTGSYAPMASADMSMPLQPAPRYRAGLNSQSASQTPVPMPMPSSTSAGSAGAPMAFVQPGPSQQMATPMPQYSQGNARAFMSGDGDFDGFPEPLECAG